MTSSWGSVTSNEQHTYASDDGLSNAQPAEACKLRCSLTDTPLRDQDSNAVLDYAFAQYPDDKLDWQTFAVNSHHDFTDKEHCNIVESTVLDDLNKVSTSDIVQPQYPIDYPNPYIVYNVNGSAKDATPTKHGALTEPFPVSAEKISLLLTPQRHMSAEVYDASWKSCATGSWRHAAVLSGDIAETTPQHLSASTACTILNVSEEEEVCENIAPNVSLVSGLLQRHECNGWFEQQCKDSIYSLDCGVSAGSQMMSASPLKSALKKRCQAESQNYHVVDQRRRQVVINEELNTYLTVEVHSAENETYQDDVADPKLPDCVHYELPFPELLIFEPPLDFVQEGSSEDGPPLSPPEAYRDSRHVKEASGELSKQHGHVCNEAQLCQSDISCSKH